MDAKKRIKRAKVQLNRLRPFFGYLTMYLDVKEVSDGMRKALEHKDSNAGMVLSPDGTIFFEEEYIDGLSDRELEALLAHEVMHLVLGQFFGAGRRLERDEGLWNLAMDIKVNQLLQEDGFNLPDNALKPEGRRDYIDLSKFGIGDFKIGDLSDKSTEKVFQDLRDNLGDDGMGGKGKSEEEEQEESDVMQDGGGMDAHMDPDEFEAEEMDEKSDVQRDWERNTMKALEKARQKGEVPAGLERFVDELGRVDLDWRTLLSNYISRNVISDYSWRRPSKKGRSIGWYLPKVKREGFDVVVALDTSGSISKDDLQSFVSEVWGIVSCFEGVGLTVVQHDAEVQKVDELSNVSKSDLESLEFKGGGGTDHRPVFDWLEEEYSGSAGVLVGFSDLYSSFPERKPVGMDVLWVVEEGNYDKGRVGFGKVVEK